MNAAAIRSITRFFETDHILPTGSGTVGLTLALETVGVADKRVLVPALTCPNVAIAVYAAGGTPVAVDVAHDDYNLDVASVANAMDSEVRAVIAVNSFGYPAEVRGIREIAERSGVVVIEDACQSYGGRADDGVLGNRADIGVISFGYSKPVALNGGGAVVTRSRDLHRELAARAASHSSGNLRDLKNRVAVRLMKAGRNRLFRLLARRGGLLEYGFPTGPAVALERAWRNFLQALEENRRCLHEARQLIAGLPQVEPFDYRGERWLPWRLSFKLAEPWDDEGALSLLRKAKVPTTRLYQPLTEVFDIEVGAPLLNAQRLTSRTVNLRYQTTSQEIRHLTVRLRRALDMARGSRVGAGKTRIVSTRNDDPEESGVGSETNSAPASLSSSVLLDAAIHQYYSAFPVTDPAYTVIRIAGEAVRDRAARHFRGRLLDIGCGTKAKAALVAEYVDEHVGLDHEDSPHDTSNVDLFGSADRIPAPDDSFDCVLSTAVLEHLEEPARAIREAWRVLRPGGVALYTAPLFWHVHEAPRDFFRYTEHGLRYLFEGAGFQIDELTALSGFWVTASAELGYYLQRFRRGPLAPIVDGWVAILNWMARKLDGGRLRDERFTWMYLVVARKPGGPAVEDARAGGSEADREGAS